MLPLPPPYIPFLQIAGWLANRSLQLDAATGQLPYALQLLELAADKGYAQFVVELPSSSSSSTNRVSTASTATAGTALSPRWSGSSHEAPHVATAAAATAATPCCEMQLQQLLVQGKVLLQIVNSWWPVDQQQQQPRNSGSSGGESGRHDGAAGAAPDQPPSPAAVAVAAAEAAASVLPPLWSVTLQQWVSAGLLAQLLAVLGGSSRDLLRQDLQERYMRMSHLNVAG